MHAADEGRGQLHGPRRTWVGVAEHVPPRARRPWRTEQGGQEAGGTARPGSCGVAGRAGLYSDLRGGLGAALGLSLANRGTCGPPPRPRGGRRCTPLHTATCRATPRHCSRGMALNHCALWPSKRQVRPGAARQASPVAGCTCKVRAKAASHGKLSKTLALKRPLGASSPQISTRQSSSVRACRGATGMQAAAWFCSLRMPHRTGWWGRSRTAPCTRRRRGRRCRRPGDWASAPDRGLPRVTAT